MYQHFLGHHIFTGIEEFDPDLYTNKRGMAPPIRTN